eukprot:11233747-Alexandrium_andersonii.AAC.1
MGALGGEEGMLERSARLLAEVSKDGRHPAEVLKQIGDEVNAAVAAGKEDKDKDDDGSGIKRARTAGRGEESPRWPRSPWERVSNEGDGLAAAGWGEHATARAQLESEDDGVASALADSCVSDVQRTFPPIEASLEEVCGALGGASWEGVVVPRWDGLARLDVLRVA